MIPVRSYEYFNGVVFHQPGGRPEAEPLVGFRRQLPPAALSIEGIQLLAADRVGKLFVREIRKIRLALSLFLGTFFRRNDFLRFWFFPRFLGEV